MWPKKRVWKLWLNWSSRRKLKRKNKRISSLKSQQREKKGDLRRRRSQGKLRKMINEKLRFGLFACN